MKISNRKLQPSRVFLSDAWNEPLTHQNRTIAIASDFRVDGAKSPEIPQKEWVLGSEIAARNRKSLATFHRTNRNAALLSLVSEIAAISGVRDGHRNRKSQKSLRFRCAKNEPQPVNPPNLVTRPKYPPPSQDRCGNTPVEVCFLWCRRLSLLHPHSCFKNGLSQSTKTGLTREGESQKKLASEAYRATGGVARNSIANRAIVGAVNPRF